MNTSLVSSQDLFLDMSYNDQALFLNSLHSALLNHTMAATFSSPHIFLLSVTNFIPFIHSLPLRCALFLSEVCKMVWEQACIALNLFLAATHGAIMWMILFAIIASLISYLFFHTNNTFKHNLHGNVFRPHEYGTTNNADLTYSTGTKVKTEKIGKKWKNADASWNKRAMQVAFLLQSNNHAQRKHRSNHKIRNTLTFKADSVQKTESRATEVTSKVKPAPKQHTFCDLKSNTMSVKVCKATVLETKFDKYNLAVRKVRVSGNKMMKNTTRAEVDEKENIFPNDRCMKLDDQGDVKQQIETQRRERCYGSKDAVRRERCPSMKNRCSSNVFRMAAMEYYAKRHNTRLEAKECEDGDGGVTSIH